VINERVEKAAKILGLDEYLDRKPKALSGGQRQRVAMGRAIVRNPAAFLMDEPLSNLDAKLRVQMRSEISRIQADLEVTTLYVTHDQVEAMTMGDRVAVLRKGELQQAGTPTELFERPKNVFVAGFIGSPSMNFVSSRLKGGDGSLGVSIGEQDVRLDDSILEEHPQLRDFVDKDIILGIRPQDFEDAEVASDAPDNRRIQAHIDLVEAIGTETLVHFKVDAPLAITEDIKELAADVGGEDPSSLEKKAKEGQNEFVAQLDPKTKIKEGADVELVIDTTRLHFFNPDTSESLRAKG
jgi:multiple sugar transport system ATP-binding protein